MVRRIPCVALCAVVLFLMGDWSLAQEVDLEPGVSQADKMPRGRRSRDEVRTMEADMPPESLPTPAQVTTLSSGAELLPENTPFPPRGFAKGTVVVIGDDSGPMGTYRLGFRFQGSGQVMPFMECKMFEAFENHLAEHGRNARHGGLAVEVKGYVTQYRGINFLFLHDYRMAQGALPGGGAPSSPGSATTKTK